MNTIPQLSGCTASPGIRLTSDLAFDRDRRRLFVAVDGKELQKSGAKRFGEILGSSMVDS
jgi:hypothetical protein